MQGVGVLCKRRNECKVWVFRKSDVAIALQKRFATAGGAAIIFVAIMTHTMLLLCRYHASIPMLFQHA